LKLIEYMDQNKLMKIQLSLYYYFNLCKWSCNYACINMLMSLCDCYSQAIGELVLKRNWELSHINKIASW
jgi:hypothetical protein